MSKKISLHEFQSYLAARLAGTSNQSSAGLLAFRRDQTTGCSTWQTRAKSFR
jgi:hypothetical protein